MCAIKQLSQKSYWKDMMINYNHGWRNLFQSGGAQVHIKKLRKMCVVWIGNCDVTSIEILRRCLYNIWRSKLHYFRQLTPLWKRIGEPPEIQIGCYGGTQVNSVTRAHRTIYSDWIKPFDACVTGISICFHSGWHYCCSVTLVIWWVLMISSPLLSNVRHAAVITPVSPLLTRTRLIHISPSCWTIYGSFEIILQLGTVHWIGLQIRWSTQIHCFKIHSVWYESSFKKYLMA